MESHTPSGNNNLLNKSLIPDESMCHDSENSTAKSFCEECKKILCDTCVVASHLPHASKISTIQAYLDTHETEFYEIKRDSLKILHMEIQNGDPSDRYSELYKNVEKDHNERVNFLNACKLKLENLIEEENSNYDVIKEKLNVINGNSAQARFLLCNDIDGKISYIIYKLNNLRNQTIYKRINEIVNCSLENDINNLQNRVQTEMDLLKSNNPNRIENILGRFSDVMNLKKFKEDQDNLISEISKKYSLSKDIIKKNFKEIDNIETNSLNVNTKYNKNIQQNTNEKNLSSFINNTPNDLFSDIQTDNPINLKNTQIRIPLSNEFSNNQISENLINENSIDQDMIIIPNNSNQKNLNSENNNNDFSLFNQNYQENLTNPIPSGQNISPPKPDHANNLNNFSPLKLNGKSHNHRTSTDIGQNVINESSSHKGVFENSYLIGIKSKPNNEICVFNSKNLELKTHKIDECSYEEKSINKSGSFPYENSKYVNFGDGALVTGGNLNKSASDHCFKISIFVDKAQNEKLIISKYTNLITKRERHNILFLENLNSVMVCSGFYVKNCEISNLTDKKWNKLPDLSETRGNATMFVVNQSFVYVMGGFKVTDSNGEYLNSLEFMDMNKKDKWTIVEMDTINPNYIIKISAMGCLGIEENKMLLIGGYDGSAYLKSGFEVDFSEEGEIKSINKKENLLQKGSIFFSNPMFMKISNHLYFNYELQAKGIYYDNVKNEFNFAALNDK